MQAGGIPHLGHDREDSTDLLLIPFSWERLGVPLGGGVGTRTVDPL